MTGKLTVTNYAYDVYGNIANVEQEIGALAVDMDYVYNADLHLESITYPSGVEVQYAYDSAGRVSRITLDEGLSSTTLIDNITYQPFGPVKGYDQDNGITVSLDYNLDGRIENITAGSVIDRDYAYELAGNIEALDDGINNALDRSYTYDAINRLSLEENLAGTTTLFDYAYDYVGNRTLYDDTVTSQSLSYGSTNNRLTAIGANSVTSDNNGNITSIHGMTLAYDAHNRLSSAIVSSITTSYTYNGIGERVTKQTGSNIAHYFYTGPNLVAEYDDTGAVEREYVYLQDQPVVMLDHTGSNLAIYWIQNDHLGRPLALTDAAGDVVWRLNDADAFGNAASIDEDPDNDSVDLTFNLRFPGQYFDAETNLHYNYLRDYDPRTGRYIESDPIGLKGGINTYLYTSANSLIYIDPLGLLSTLDTCKSPKNFQACAEAGMYSTKQASDAINTIGSIIAMVEAANSEDWNCPNEKCKKAIEDAKTAFDTLKDRFSKYLTGGSRGSDYGHYKAIGQMQNNLNDALRRIKLHCKNLPPQFEAWEKMANFITPILY